MSPGEQTRLKVSRNIEAFKLAEWSDSVSTSRPIKVLKDLRPLLITRVSLLALSILVAGCNSQTSASSTTTSVAQHRRLNPGYSFSKPVEVAKGPIEALSCVSRSFCMAASGDGTMYEFNGQSWTISLRSSASMPAPSGVVHPTVDCFSIKICIGELADSSLSVFSGNAWSTPSRIPGAQPIAAIGCSPTGSCLAIDAVGDGFLFRNGAWSEAFNAWGSAVSISCAAANFCAAAGGGVSFWNGSFWTKPIAADPSGLPTAISCVTAGFCMLSDNEGRTMIWNGASWTNPVRVITGRLVSLSCLSSRWCVAAGGNAEVAVFDGGSWRTISTGISDLKFTALSCTGVGRCELGDAKGQVISLHVGQGAVS